MLTDITQENAAPQVPHKNTCDMTLVTHRTVNSWAKTTDSNAKHKASLSFWQTWKDIKFRSLEVGWFPSEKWWNILTKHCLGFLIGGIALISSH